MKVSVVVCTYSMDRYGPFADAVESVLAQTHDDLEVVLVVDGNDDVFERVRADFGDEEHVVLHCNDENQGISYSRTKGAKIASGDIVAFIDDDATAEDDWIEQLLGVYAETDAIAVGGDVVPDWQTQKPDFFPAEFYWLVGCVEPGFAEDGEEVRNTYGSNISYRRDQFLDVGGYDPNTGRKGDKHLQAHEAPVGIRLREEYGRGMVFTRDARVHHKLFDYRGEFGWLVSRSFWQGYSKRVMDLLYPNAEDNKSSYLRQLLTRFVPKRVENLVRSPSLTRLQQLVAIFVFTVAVGLGYVYAVATSNLVEKANS
ncbi:glucosyl-dolichyl phosphate glucuronosyltransferase [Halobacterium salinarum]|uniref:glucosyl-dolichyl phosphate glucuronosyltransferase n=1 Tax=Halobacterium salinarum TaxID=2242 RepID=UPI002557C237|nr:glucosyl-dolichyl phosphate glucuronosyltransferase [Halobacterium salinarum]MDL0120432.1 glucosyl-dolichyl phosphate glucuronosyltransferase [Halobacterium salinarum]